MLSALFRRFPSMALLALVVLLAATGCKERSEDEPTRQQQEAAAQKAAESDESPDGRDRERAEDKRKDDGAKEGKEPTSTDQLDEGTQKQKNMLARGKRAFLDNQRETAERQFEELAKTGPVSGAQVSGIIALAQIYIETDRPDEAMELYDDLSDEAASLPEVELVIARSLAEQGEFDEAIEVYESLLETKPNFVFAQVELANAHAEAGHKDRAARALFEYEKRLARMVDALRSDETGKEGRLRLLDVFSLLNDERASSAVADLLDADDAAVRIKAARVLGQTRSLEERDALEEVADNDDDAQVRKAAKEAIEQLDELEEKAGGGDALDPDDIEDEHELSDALDEERGDDKEE